MTVLNAATRVKLGTAGARRVYAGSNLAWEFVPYLGIPLGSVSTPDTPDMGIAGPVRFTLRMSMSTAPSSGFPLVVRKETTPVATQREVDMYVNASGGQLYIDTATGTATTGLVIAVIPSGDHDYGAEVTPNVRDAVTIFDGVRTAKLFSNTPLFPDTTQPVIVGTTVSNGMVGRIYWAQMEAINRAQLVFPGSGGNYLSTPHFTASNLSGDFEAVARFTYVSGMPGMTLAAKNGMWYLWVNPTNVSVGWTYQAGGSTFPGSSAHNFVNGTTYWIKVTRVAATGLTSFYWAADQASEPTTWTALNTVTSTTGALAQVAQPITVGVYSIYVSPFRGRMQRVILRDGIGGTVYFDLSENNAASMTGNTFVNTTGQMMTANASVKFVFPGVAGNYMTVPHTAAHNVTGDLEIVARLAPTSWAPAARGVVIANDTTGAQPRGWIVRLGPSGAIEMVWPDAAGTGQIGNSSTVLPFTNGGFGWIKVTRASATGTVSYYSAPDDATTNEPTTWTARGTAATYVGALTSPARGFYVGARTTSGATEPFDGRISRVIVRNGIGGTVVYDLQEGQQTLDAATTVAAVGGTTTATVTAGNDIIQADTSQPIVRPQANQVVWRFDAKDYPGTGLTYVDPRGRTWTLSASGAITVP